MRCTLSKISQGAVASRTKQKCLINAWRVSEVVVSGENWRYTCKLCKAPVKSSPPTNQRPTFYRPDALPVAQPTVSKHWRESFKTFSRRHFVEAWCTCVVGSTCSFQHCQHISSTTAREMIATDPCLCLLTIYSTVRFCSTNRQLKINMPCVYSAMWLPRAGSGVVRMDPLRFLAGYRTRRLNQA